jgi:hypothetical protein
VTRTTPSTPFRQLPERGKSPEEPPFEAAKGTPTVNGLTGALLTENPNAVNPQNLAMGRLSDAFFDTESGATVMGHLNLISGQRHQTGTADVKGKIVNGSVIANVDPVTDDCASGTEVEMSGRNVGDLLNEQ